LKNKLDKDKKIYPELSLFRIVNNETKNIKALTLNIFVIKPEKKLP
jgi:hypothetical protein